MNELFKRLTGVALGLALTLGAGITAFTVGNGAVKTEAATEETYDWTKAPTTSSTSTVTWEGTNTSVKLEKKSSQTSANNYLGGANDHTRVYKGQLLTFISNSGYKLTGIKITANSTDYAKNFVNGTWTGGTATSSSSTVTVTPANDLGEGDITVSFGAATRATKIVVSYEAVNSTEPSIEIDQSFNEMLLEVGDNETLTATTKNASSAIVNWVSSDTSVATIGLTTGTLTALKSGNTNITASITVGTKTYTSTVKIYVAYEEPEVVNTTIADLVNFNSSDANKYAYVLKGTILSWGKSNSSTDPKDDYGNMTLTDGTNTILVYGSTATEGKLEFNPRTNQYVFNQPYDFNKNDFTIGLNKGDTITIKGLCYLYNSKPQLQGEIIGRDDITTTDIELSSQNIELIEGETTTLSATLTPTNSTEVITWESSNNEIATVSKDGEIKALKYGEVTIKATSGSHFDTCALKVYPKVVKVTGNGESVDTLNNATTGNTTINYVDWSGKTDNSGAVYSGQSAGSNSTIQLRSKNNNSGIVVTSSENVAKKVVVEWQKDTMTGRTLNIYGKNSAYTAPTDLYSSSTQGTLLGTIVCGTSTELEIDGSYNFIGLRSADGALYLTSVEISWFSGSVESSTLENAKNVEAFVQNDLKFGEFGSEIKDKNGACKEWYQDALEAYENLTDIEKHLFDTHEAYEEARERASAWSTFVENGSLGLNLLVERIGGNNMYIVIIIAALVAASALTAYLVINKKRKINK